MRSFKIGILFLFFLTTCLSSYGEIDILGCKEIKDATFDAYNKKLFSGYGAFYNCPGHYDLIFHLVLVNENKRHISFEGVELYAVGDDSKIYKLEMIEYHNLKAPGKLTVEPSGLIDFSYRYSQGYAKLKKVKELFLDFKRLGKLYLVPPDKVEAYLSPGQRFQRGLNHLLNYIKK